MLFDVGIAPFGFHQLLVPSCPLYQFLPRPVLELLQGTSRGFNKLLLSDFSIERRDIRLCCAWTSDLIWVECKLIYLEFLPRFLQHPLRYLVL